MEAKWKKKKEMQADIFPFLPIFFENASHFHPIYFDKDSVYDNKLCRSKILKDEVSVEFKFPLPLHQESWLSRRVAINREIRWLPETHI